MTTDILWRWDGEAMVLARPRYSERADEQFVVGQTYILDIHTPEDARSRRSHAHYFALVGEYWQNLPERLTGEPWALTPEFLRHYALIRTGHVNVETFTCGTRAEALRWRGMLPAPVNDKGERVYAIYNVEGSVLTRITPKSQSYKYMKAKAFQKSKTDVLDFLADLIGARLSEVAA